MRSDLERLKDILQGIKQIEEYTIDGKKSFEQNTLIQSAVLFQILVIGEAVGDLSLNLREQYQDIPWAKIIGMRNIVAHEYFRIDLKVVWAVVENYLPQLKSKIELILQDLEADK